MDWLSPVNAGAPSALVLKEGDSVYCRICDRMTIGITCTPTHGEIGWLRYLQVDSKVDVTIKGSDESTLALRCAVCSEPQLVYSPNLPDAPLEMRPKD